MACVLNRSDPADTFRNWLKRQSELNAVAEKERLKREQMNRLLNGDTF
ncbi:hypothetical protein [Clostridium sp. Marseille-P2415]|nr:hypothetical protein [Clostridium sp. Marseille-P2415]